MMKLYILNRSLEELQAMSVAVDQNCQQGKYFRLGKAARCSLLEILSPNNFAQKMTTHFIPRHCLDPLEKLNKY